MAQTVSRKQATALNPFPPQQAAGSMKIADFDEVQKIFSRKHAILDNAVQQIFSRKQTADNPVPPHAGVLNQPAVDATLGKHSPLLVIKFFDGVDGKEVGDPISVPIPECLSYRIAKSHICDYFVGEFRRAALGILRKLGFK